jgi:phage shock protein C
MTCARCARQIEADSAYCRYCGARTAAAGGRRLARLPERGKIAGVCAGIADYFDTDVSLVRLLWVVLSIIPGALIGGVIVYAAAWILMSVGVAPATAPPERLVRPLADRKIAGVCGGLARYFHADPTFVRLAWVILTIYPCAIVFGVIAYIAAWLIIPSERLAPMQPVTSPV